MKRQFFLMAAATVLAALCATLFATPALAQTGTVKGVALDEQGQPMTGAVVEMQNLDNGQKYHLKVDKKGNFFSIGIAYGKYNIQLMKDGKQQYNYTNFPVHPGDDNVVDFKLNEIRKATETGQAAPAPPGAVPQKLTPEQQKQLEEQRKQAEAIQKENNAIKNLNNLLAQAVAAKQAGQNDQAITLMQQAVQADATRDLLWAKLGEFQLDKARQPGLDVAGRTTTANEALESYKKAVQLCTEKPTSPSCKDVAGYHNNMGQALAMTGHTPEAIAEYNAAAQLNPANAAQYYYNEGAVLTNTGKADEANEAFAKAIQSDPNKAEAYYQKGVNLLAKATIDPKSGKTVYPDEAKKDIEKYLELQPQGPMANDAKVILQTMGETVQTSYGTKSKKK